jgi:signal transduction histidine kinase
MVTPVDRRRRDRRGSAVVAEERLHETEAQLRQLAARLQMAREEERKVLARELHDELGQTLTAIKLELARLIPLFKEQRLSDGIDRLQSLVGLAEIGIESVKRITTDLRPATLDHLGLPSAVRWEAITFRARTGLRCRVTSAPEKTSLTADQEIGVFRILQEALTNVVRHARASAVDVHLAEARGRFELRVRDNGRGVTEAEARSPKAIGLLGMRERAALIGGAFEISGRRGRGTIVTVQIPLRPRRGKSGTTRGPKVGARR